MQLLLQHAHKGGEDQEMVAAYETDQKRLRAEKEQKLKELL